MDLNALRNLVDSENRISQAPVQEKKSLTPEELESEVQRRVEQLSSEEIGDGVNENSIRQLLLLRQAS